MAVNPGLGAAAAPRARTLGRDHGNRSSRHRPCTRPATGGAGALGTDTRSVLLRMQRSAGRSPGRFAFFPALWRLGGRHLRAEDRALDPSPAYRAETPIRKYAFT
jgi:hypothetical protein